MNLKEFLNEKKYSMGIPKTKYEEEIFKADQALNNLLTFMSKKRKNDTSGIYHDLYAKHAGQLQDARRKLTAFLNDVPVGTE